MSFFISFWSVNSYSVTTGWNLLEGGKKVNTAAMMTQHNLAGNGLSCFSCALYPSTAGGNISQSGVRVKWPPQSGEAGRGREHCHLVISRHTAINTSYFPPGLANWLIHHPADKMREEDIGGRMNFIKSQKLFESSTTNS